MSKNELAAALYDTGDCKSFRSFVAYKVKFIFVKTVLFVNFLYTLCNRISDD